MFVFVSNTKDCYFIRQDREWEKYNGVGGGGQQQQQLRHG